VTPAAWAWVALASGILVFVGAFDTWAHFANRWSMSAQFSSWLHGPLTGPLIMGLFFGTLVALWWHWLVTH
jgi:hypothetical protein